MRITQIRDDGRVNTLRTLKIEQLVEQMKVETKAQLVSGMREVLPYIFREIKMIMYRKCRSCFLRLPLSVRMG